MNTSAGCVIFEQGKVWLIKPANAFGGYEYTFPKGRNNKGETLEVAAVRETLEETGLQVSIIQKLFTQTRSTSYTAWYLASRVGGNSKDFDPCEVEAVLLVTPCEAMKLLNTELDNEVLSIALAASSQVTYSPRH
jgi:ADP-ribose pyrophosphatase YjhB (NUDIX family)